MLESKQFRHGGQGFLLYLSDAQQKLNLFHDSLPCTHSWGMVQSKVFFPQKNTTCFRCCVNYHFMRETKLQVCYYLGFQCTRSSVLALFSVELFQTKIGAFCKAIAAILQSTSSSFRSIQLLSCQLKPKSDRLAQK